MVKKTRATNSNNLKVEDSSLQLVQTGRGRGIMDIMDLILFLHFRATSSLHKASTALHSPLMTNTYKSG